MFPVLQIGPLAIQVPGLVLLGGLWIGLYLSEKFAPQRGLKPNQIYNLVFIGLITGVLSARIGYILRYPDVFISSPSSMISLSPSLLDVWMGIGGGLIAGLIYGGRKQMPFWATLDTLTPMLASMGLALSLSHVASGAAFGMPANLPWSIELWGARRHPAQIYESIAATFILVFTWPGRSIWRKAKAGMYFMAFIASSAFASLFLQAFRGDSYLLPGGIRSAQVVAWFILALSLWGIFRLTRHITTVVTNEAEQ